MNSYVGQPQDELDVPKTGPIFTVVIPAYNVEDYLEEAVQSILEQDIGFDDHVEIVIVNDGSTDKSGEIADRLAHERPANIHVIHQVNQGVSMARNNGMAQARGLYVGFLDPDDKYSPETFRQVKNFFDAHGDAVDVVGIPIVFFEAREGAHQLNNKFEDGTRVIDVEKEWYFQQSAVMSAFVRNSALKKYGIKLDTKLKYAEDSKFMTQIIMQKKKFGVVREAQLNYRKRNVKNSALDTSESRKEYYLPVIKNFSEALFNEFRDIRGKIPRYVQQIVCYDLQWRIKQRHQDVLDAFELDEYQVRIQRLLTEIDYEVIQKQRHIYIDHKLYMMSLKRYAPAVPDLKLRGNSVMLDGHRVWGAYPAAYTCVVSSIVQEGDRLKIRGTFRGLPVEGIEVGFVEGKNFYPSRKQNVPNNKKAKFLDEVIFEPIGFYYETQAKGSDRIRPAVKIGNEVHSTQFQYDKNSRLPNGRTSYRIFDTVILQNVENRYLARKHLSFREIVKRELSYLKTLFKGDLGRAVERRKPVLAFYRIASILAKFGRKKPLWVISDRLTEGGDNGEALFRYLQNTDLRKTHSIVYLLTKESPDHAELKKVGKVVDPRTLRGMLTVLSCDVLAASHIDDYVVNPLGKDWKLVSDLYRFKLVFLQHGVILHDISNWLNIFDKPISRIIVTGLPERDSLLGNQYGFDETEVAMTGLARHDRLDPTRKRKKITLAPTWRKTLAGSMDLETMERAYNPEFVDSDYFKFFNSLLNDQTLLSGLKANGYELDFVLHPALASQISDFQATDPVNIIQPPYVYRDIVSESAMFITDFSSVVSDAAYLRKRVAYCHFDSLLDGEHIVKQGYYDYQRDGFGPVLFSVEALVSEILDAISNDCEVDPVYEDRMNCFFAYNDSQNCSRITQRILELE